MRHAALLALLVTACGGSSTVTASDAGHDASSGGSAGAEAGVAGASGSGGSGFDAPDEPVDPWADSGPIDGGPFDCGGCICNGGTNYCFFAAGGAATLRDLPPDAAACPDAGTYGCIALPPACSAAPSCKCVMGAVPYSPACTCEDTGGGISVHCYYP